MLTLPQALLFALATVGLLGCSLAGAKLGAGLPGNAEQVARDAAVAGEVSPPAARPES